MRRRAYLVIAVAVSSVLTVGVLVSVRLGAPPRDYVAEFDALAALLQPSARTENSLNGWDVVREIGFKLADVERGLDPENSKRLRNMGPLYSPAATDTAEDIELSNRGLSLYEEAGIFEMTPRLLGFAHATVARDAGELSFHEHEVFIGNIARFTARILAAKCRRAIDQGEADAAIDRYEEGITLARMHMLHPTALDHVISFAISATMMLPLQRGIAEGKLDVDALERAAGVTDLLTNSPPLTTWLEGQSLIDLHHAREPNLLDRRRVTQNLEEYYAAAIRLVAATPANRDMDPSLATLDRRIRALHADRTSFVSARFEPSSARRYIAAVDRFLCDLQAMRLLIALERHRLRTGDYPNALDALVPGELADLDTRPRTSFPLVYRRTDDGFTLYSVGADGIDNGGIPSDEDPDDAFTPGGAGSDFKYR